VNEALARWNQIPADAAEEEILLCCGSRAWANAVTARRPFANAACLSLASAEVWCTLGAADWMEAFRSHPRIGESAAKVSASTQSRAWSTEEQKNVSESADGVKTALAEGNRQYEERFGRIFIVCATGKSLGEILEILRRRLQNDEAAELREAADEQQRITQIRLRKWFGQ
jgi:2-oxo-4-hydroxy-4-carboxy-5-ureidoimidazoline decarboxylase